MDGLYWVCRPRQVNPLRKLPVALRNAEQARVRTDFDARFGIGTDANAAVFERMLDYGELQMRYRYGADDTVDTLRAQPGMRFPHAWIEHQGQRRSTLDLSGSLQSRSVAHRPPSPKRMSPIVLEDDDVITIRPDGFVGL